MLQFSCNYKEYEEQITTKEHDIALKNLNSFLDITYPEASNRFCYTQYMFIIKHMYNTCTAKLDNRLVHFYCRNNILTNVCTF